VKPIAQADRAVAGIKVAVRAVEGCKAYAVRIVAGEPEEHPVAGRVDDAREGSTAGRIATRPRDDSDLVAVVRGVRCAAGRAGAAVGVGDVAVRERGGGERGGASVAGRIGGSRAV